MFEVFSSEQCKKMDSSAINNIGIPSTILMENAAIGICNEILNIGESFLILCGKGNNGGDALAVARHLILEGKKVKVYIISKDESYTEDCRINLNIVKKLIDPNDLVFIRTQSDIDIKLENDFKNYDIVVDGIFGVGLNKEPNGMFKDIINYANKNSKYIVSIDVPSGLNSNIESSREASINADLTLTFEVIKKGFLNYSSLDNIGKLKVLKIGIPKFIKEENSEKMYILEDEEYTNLIPKRELYGHKGNYGRAIVVAGSNGFTGAAFITTECTVRTGAGLTTLACRRDIQNILSGKLIEAMTINLEDDKFIETIRRANTIAFGPGIGTSKIEEELLENIIKNSNCPIVIDADGITILSRNKNFFDDLRGRTIITPHPGEMAKFLGTTVEQVEKDRMNIAREVAKKYNIVVLLKGYNTVISDGISTYINPTGNSKMSSGGMGDALTGIINGLLSQGSNVYEAAILGAYIHGKIADELAIERYIVNARDIIKELPKQINSIIKK